MNKELVPESRGEPMCDHFAMRRASVPGQKQRTCHGLDCSHRIGIPPRRFGVSAIDRRPSSPQVDARLLSGKGLHSFEHRDRRGINAPLKPAVLVSIG